jgi:hypothetical protein
LGDCERAGRQREAKREARHPRAKRKSHDTTPFRRREPAHVTRACAGDAKRLREKKKKAGASRLPAFQRRKERQND